VNKYIREEILSINMNENGMFEDIEVGILSNIYLKTNETRERERRGEQGRGGQRAGPCLAPRTPAASATDRDVIVQVVAVRVAYREPGIFPSFHLFLLLPAEPSLWALACVKQDKLKGCFHACN
jgi:hypothetical protein